MDWVPMNDLSRAVEGHRAELMAQFEAVLDSGWFLTGPRTTTFAAQLAAYLDVPHVLPVGNGTDALEIALRALMPDGRSTVMGAANAGGYGTVAARRAGFEVTFADVDPGTHCLDPDDVAARITDVVGVVIVTHLYGRAADVAPIVEAAHSVGALVLEDCAQALGLDRRWTRGLSRGRCHLLLLSHQEPRGIGGRRRDRHLLRRARAAQCAAFTSTAGTASTAWSMMVGATPGLTSSRPPC